LNWAARFNAAAELSRQSGWNYLDTVEVIGSIPVAPTFRINTFLEDTIRKRRFIKKLSKKIGPDHLVP
jgi:hypothetical protein